MAAKKLGLDHISGVIRRNLNSFRKPGVLTVRPGYEVRNHQLTGKEAIVATVHTKKKDVARGEALPNSVEGIPVDVREATPYQRLRAADPGSAAIAMTYGRPELKEPAWPGELEMPSGAPVAGGPIPPHIALEAHARKPQLPYTAPPDVSLDPIEGAMTITAAVSPDCGLDTLDEFLSSTQSSLVMAMYDFTSGHILEKFEKALEGSSKLQMVLDNPALNHTADQSDPETVRALQQALDSRFRFNWALERGDRHVNAWVFPSAYHIKVIVRDGKTIWLSSGNLNNSNEPDPDAPPRTEDRDWHVVVESEQLAHTFSAFIQNDFALASHHQQDAVDEVQSAITRANLKLAQNVNPPPPPISSLPTAAAPKTHAKPRTFQNENVRITPLLTPDTLPGNGAGQYASRMIDLINSAKESLDIQLQYVEVPRDDSPGDLKDLLLAVKALVEKGEVKVRILQSLQFGEKWAERMRSMPDIDLTSVMRLQPNVHNKGFVIDSRKVVVSSQNWSQEGVRQNRDAGLIIESAPIAQYFDKIFAADWDSREPFDATFSEAKQKRLRNRG
jgi:phosphatidylserine/phosphatidylglycerophosphate/cardiolipin synthase-like enzyme